MKLIYGVFSELGSAKVARDVLHERAGALDHDQEVASMAIHQHDIAPNELPRAGTIAVRAAIGGAALVGSVVGVVLALLATGVFAKVGRPSIATGAEPLHLVLLTLAAAAFGGILAAIAGRAGNRARIRRLEQIVADGKVLLTISAPEDRIRSVLATMIRAGALRTGTI